MPESQRCEDNKHIVAKVHTPFEQPSKQGADSHATLGHGCEDQGSNHRAEGTKIVHSQRDLRRDQPPRREGNGNVNAPRHRVGKDKVLKADEEGVFMLFLPSVAC